MAEADEVVGMEVRNYSQNNFLAEIQVNKIANLTNLCILSDCILCDV